MSTDASTSNTLVVRSPWTRAPVGELARTSRDAAFTALDRAHALHRSGARLPLALRVRVLRAVGEAIQKRREELARQIALEGGKPLTDALVEVDRAASGAHYLAGEVERLAGDEIPMGATAATEGRLAFTTLEPIGPVLAISAFNHPLNLAMHQLGPAIAAGCPALFKPALETPLSGATLIELFREAGLPDGWASLLVTDNETTEALVRDRRVAYVSFIGSAAVGWRLRSVAAPGARVALEHGGAAPVLVDEGADLDRAATLITKGGYYHAGQVCVSVQRVIAHERIADALVERLAACASSLVVGDPSSDKTDVGPLIRERDAARVEAWVDEARTGSARIVTGGTRTGSQVYTPTLVVEPSREARLWTEEVFGPVVAVARVTDLDAAVALANASRWAFQAAVFTPDLARALRAARALDAATVLLNDHTAFRADWMPFGGRHESGLGTGGLHLGVRDLCATKLIVLRG
ncbi:MAG: aldehyde dehydrogenase family protein [Polyangiaceae bacterium]